MNCINVKHPDFIKLSQDSNLDSFELEIAVSQWQKQNNSDEFPTVDQIVSKPYVADTKIKEQLLEILNKNGVSVTSMKEYEENYSLRVGKDLTVGAIADTVNSVIAIDSLYENELTVPEEAMHMAVASQVGTFDFNRAMRLVVETEEYKNNYDLYSKAYSNLNEVERERKIKMEILGKIGAKRLLQNLKDGQGTGIWKYLRNMWNKFKQSIMSAKPGLEQIINKWVGEFVEGKNSIQPEGVFFQVEENTPELTEGEKLFEKLIKGMKAKLAYQKQLAARGKSLEKYEKRIDELVNLGKEAEIALGMFKFIKYMTEDIKVVQEFIDNFRKGKIAFNSRNYRDMKMMLDYYLPHKSQIKNYFQFSLEKDVLGEKKTKKLIERINKATIALDEINTFHKIQGGKLSLVEGETVAKEAISNPEVLEKELENINDVINAVTYDSNKAQFYFGSLVHAKDSFQRILHAAVAKIKRAVDRFVYDLGKDLTIEAEKLGITETSKFIAKDAAGKFTRFFIDRFRTQEFENAQKSFHKAIHAEFGLPDDNYERGAIKRRWAAAVEAVENGTADQEQENLAALYSSYNTKIAEFYTSNTIPILNWQARVEQVKQELGATTEAFNLWKRMNIGIGKKGTKFEFEYPKGELTTPSDGSTRIIKRGNKEYNVKTKDWIDHNYDKLTDNEKVMLDKLIKVMAQADEKHNRNRHRLQLPQIKAQTVDLIKQGKFKAIGENIKDLFRTAEDDTQFGENTEITRPDGTIAQFVPIYFINPLADPTQLSPDVISAVIAYSGVMENFSLMSKDAPTFEMILDTIGHREVNTGKEKILGVQSEVYKTMRKFMDMQVYGKMKEQWIVAGINITKLNQKLIQYVTTNNLAFSLYTTVASYVTSATYSKIEDLVGQYTTQADKFYAEKIWDTNIHEVLIEAGKTNKNSKLGLFYEQHRVIKRNSDIFKNLDKSRLTKKALQSGMFWSYELVKLRIRGKLALAIANNYKYYEGKFHTKSELKRLGVDDTNLKSYYDLGVVENGKFVLKYDGKIINDSTIEDKIERKIEYIGANIDGELSYTDWAAAHQGALLQLVTTHRGWLFRNVQLRLKNKGVNYQTGEIEEGFYMTFFDFMKRTFLSPERVKSYKELTARWSTLEPYEKQGVLRTAWEIAFIFAMSSIALILNNLASDDDDDDSYIQYFAYMSNRVLLEVSAMNPTPVLAVDPFSGDLAFRPPLLSNIQELTAILNSPVAATRQIDDLLDITNLFSSEEIESGTFEGMTKREKAIIKLTPGLKGLYQIRDPKSRNTFLKNKTLKWLARN